MLKFSPFFLIVAVAFAAIVSSAVRAQTGSGSIGFNSGSNSGSGNFPTPPVPTEPLDDRLDLNLDAFGALQLFNFTAQKYQYICSDFALDNATANIICRSLGLALPGSSSIVPNSVGDVDGAWVSDLQCAVGTIEVVRKPGACSWTTAPACLTEHTIKLSCGKIETGFSFQIGDNGLLFATRQSDGIVGQVCDDGMSDTTAQGICSTMNMVPDVSVEWWTLPNYRADPIVIESVTCPIQVTNFAEQCNYHLQTDCTPLEAVAIDCNSSAQQQPSALNAHFALDAGMDGMVLVSPSGSSRAIVGVKGRPTKATAEAICQWQGYTDTSVMLPSSTTLTTNWVFFESLSCPSGARNLQDCAYDLGRPAAEATEQTVAAVYCGDTKVSFDLRLAPTGLVQLAQPGSGQYTGTMCGAGGASGTTIRGICNIANQGVGAPYPNVAAWNIGGPSQNSILADNVRCNETARNFSDCAFDVNNYCTHDQDLAIICDTTKPNLFQFQITSQQSGSFAQVMPPGASTFLPICGDSIDQATATAVCAFSGLPTGSVNTFSEEVQIDSFGLNSLSCPANAKNIFDCVFSQAGSCSSYLKVSCQATFTSTTTSTTTTRTSTTTTKPTTTTSTTTSSTTTTTTAINAPTTTTTATTSGGAATTTTSTVASSTQTPQSTTTTAYPKNSVLFNFSSGIQPGFNADSFKNTLNQLLNISVAYISIDFQNATALVVSFTGPSSQGAYLTVLDWSNRATGLPQQIKAYGVSSTGDANSNNAAPGPSPSGPASSPTGDEGGKNNAGVIAGAIIGSILGLALIGFIVVKMRSPARSAMNDRNTVQFRSTEYVQHEEV